MSLTKQDLILAIRKDVENIDHRRKNYKELSEKIINYVTNAKQVIGFTDSDILRIFDAVDSCLEKFINNGAIREAGNVTDIYFDLLLESGIENEIIQRFKKVTSLFFNSNDRTYHVVAEDIIARVSDYLEVQERFIELGDALFDIGSSLFKIKNLEQSVAYLEQGMNSYIDEDNTQKITEGLTKILDFARRLAVKDNEFARNYIELANRTSAEAKIDLKLNPTAQLAYQSYSDLLLKQSKTMIDSRKVVPGRLHKKKRAFSTILKKKGESEEDYY